MQYYGDAEAKKYTQKYAYFREVCFRRAFMLIRSTRIQQIQADMTYRALELLNLPPDQPAFLLDIGCGSGLSGEILDEEGYTWCGCDIAPSMLGTWPSGYSFDFFLFVLGEVALERQVQGDLFLQDIGQGFGFRPGSFDGAIRSAHVAYL
jgi:18S rRNA (guanine1575-N7)-methyltransferase